MPYYRVEILGRNFLLEKEGNVKKTAFRATLMVEAFHEKEAEKKALAALKAEKKLKKMTINSIDDPPLLFVEKIKASPTPSNNLCKEITFNFFEESESELELDDLL